MVLQCHFPWQCQQLNAPGISGCWDSGASQHIANNPQAFSGLQPAKQMWVSLADGQRAAVNGEGNVYVPEIGDTLYNVFYVPALEHNLLSISVKPEIDMRSHFI
uniref:Retrovirus-related Pol polyprotein from transposon TNT 1-94-like beta-barrel domain-containing protein n=1 Tax=Micrurus surinamensis TaxID=129470 RepID=A0A2D4PYJ4_MICSU